MYVCRRPDLAPFDKSGTLSKRETGFEPVDAQIKTAALNT